MLTNTIDPLSTVHNQAACGGSPQTDNGYPQADGRMPGGVGSASEVKTLAASLSRQKRKNKMTIQSEVSSNGCKQELAPSKRCSDFDCDCVDVANHLQCWIGLESERAGIVYFTGLADGYCPFVIGMLP